jgi:hypothetical protein
MVLAGGGISAIAAGHSLPGDSLYGVKRLVESVRIEVPSGNSRWTGDLRFVSLRLREAEQLAEPGAASRAGRWNDFDRAVADADSALVRLARSAPSVQLRNSLDAERGRWQQLVPSVPAAQQPALGRVLGMIDSIATVVPAGEPAHLLPFALLGTGRVTISSALADGWPLDPTPRRPVPNARVPAAAPLVGGADGTGEAGRPPTGSSGSASRRPASRLPGATSGPGATTAPKAGPASGSRAATAATPSASAVPAVPGDTGSSARTGTLVPRLGTRRPGGDRAPEPGRAAPMAAAGGGPMASLTRLPTIVDFVKPLDRTRRSP